MSSMRRRTLIVVSLITIAVVAFYQVALALDGDQGPPVAPAVQTRLFGLESGGVQVVRQHTPSKTNSTVYGTFMGSSVQVGAFEEALIVFTFSGESACYSTTPNEIRPQWCKVRILLNGTQAEPRDTRPHTSAFDSTDATHALVHHDDVSEGPDSYESHAIQRSICVRNGEDKAVAMPFRVQWATTSTNVDFWLDDAHLTVEKFIAREGCKTPAP
jgi:hypothetical protein